MIFLSIENENGEYVLNLPLEYSTFVTILRSTTSQNPYKLFDSVRGNSSHVVELTAVQLPKDATIDRYTGLFKWTAVTCEDYVSIEACDTTINLRAKKDITFDVTVNNGNSRFNGVNYLVLSLAMIVLLYP